jgi:DNA-binding NarL/FixJ family response regulator
VVIAHRDEMVAEGLAAGLARYPDLVPIAATTTGTESVRLGERADAVAIDVGLPGAELAAVRLRRKGVRVVFLGEAEGGEDGGVYVSLRAPIESLASALAPGLQRFRPVAGVLTSREREILSLIARGFAAKQVARHLGISPKTVERHKTRIFSKLGVPNQAAAVSVGLSIKLVGSGSWT